jgi:hypothetical protein
MSQGIDAWMSTVGENVYIQDTHALCSFHSLPDGSEELLTLTFSSKRRGNFLPRPARERVGVRVVK